MSRKHRRRAFSLLEMLLVISILGVVLALATTMLGTSFRLHTRTVDRADLQRSLDQLAVRLRTDAHSAVAAKMLGEEEESPGVSLSLADGRTIVYSALANEIERRVEREGQVEHRDAFRLAGCEAELAVEKPAEASAAQGQTIVVTFRVTNPHPSASQADIAPLCAAVGLHRTNGNIKEAEE